ncbi:GTP-binding protein GEM-like [Saccostrea cucullata]|uniref:GTP-binding protein GEM-like n=1 Tax=Saccostrea cuccullata TaxID=36930 RepID=UPI002ED045FE
MPMNGLSITDNDRQKKIPSPAMAEIAMRALHVSPRPRVRSTSMKKPKVRPPEDFELDDMRPRTSSLPSKNSYKKPNLLAIKSAGILYEDSEHDLYRLRSFERTAKGLVNRGDSLISRSNNSIFSSESEYGALSQTSSSASQTSLTEHHKPYRILMMGSQGVGKTALTQQFMTSEYLGGFDTSIDGEEEKVVSVLLNGEESVLSFIDPDTENVKPRCAPNCSCIDAYVVVYCIDDRSSFDRAVDILYNLRKEEHSDSAIILVANKCELARSRLITSEEAQAVAKTYDCKFIETSTVLNHNVDELLVGILSQVRLKIKQNERSHSRLEGCVNKSKQILNKIFKKEGNAKSCENLYVL